MLGEPMFERALEELYERRARARAAAIASGTVVDIQARRAEIERRRERVRRAGEDQHLELARLNERE